MNNPYRSYVQKSLYRYTFSIILFVFLLIGIFFYVNLHWLSMEKNQTCNAQIQEMLSTQLEKYDSGLIRFSSDEVICSALNDPTSDYFYMANRLLYEFANSQKIRCAFELVNMKNEMVCSNLFERNQEIFLESSVYANLIEKIKEDPETILLTPSQLNYSYNQMGAFIVGRGIIQNGELKGYLFLEPFDETAYVAIQEYPADDVILTDRYNNLLFSIGRQMKDPMEKYPTSKFRMEWKEDTNLVYMGKYYNVQKSSLSDNSIVIYTMVSMEFQRQIAKIAFIFLMVLGILMIIMVQPLVRQLTDRNLYAIDELRHSVEEMRNGNMKYELRTQVFDEFKELNESFRNMIIHKEELMHHNAELLERKRIMEIRQLEEQINPHFIFNVLETLRYEIAIDTQKASDMVVAFANLLRYSIYYGNSIVPLHKDIEYINDYLLLQKMRYNRRLTYHIDIPDELMDCEIPKLVLQPIVENSLRHGMKDVENIHIEIIGESSGSVLKLWVIDNGVGISKEKRQELIESLQKEDIYREHIGLYNSHRVVQLLYGSEFGLSIESKLGSGTKICVTLPIDTEENNV